MLIGVGVIVLRPDGALLLGRRVYPDAPECWCLPGGKVDAGESFERTARRETAEECGLDLAPPPPFAVLLDTHNGAPRLTAAFAVAAPSDAVPRVVEPAKLAEWRWFAPDALPTPLFPATAAVLTAWRDGAAGAAAGAAVYRLAT
jgi:ADP-ribose pyrophosphatase YjhB (NUDIX family)